MNKEIRHIAGLALETREGKKMPVITGRPICFDKRSENLGGFVEVVKPEAVDLEGRDILALAHHDDRMVLGRTSAGTLKLTKDADGVGMELDPPDTNAGRDMVESVRRGDIRGMSFGFVTRKDRWTFASEGSDEPDLRELLAIDLLEVSPVAFPAYPDTTIACRSLEAARAETKPSPEPAGEAPKGPTHDQTNRQRMAELKSK